MSELKHALFYGAMKPFDVYRRIFTRTNRYIILMFHQIAEGEVLFDPVNLKTSVDDFEWQMRFLRDNFRIISLGGMIEKMSEKIAEESETFIALTFDDGYENNFRLAVPILEHYRIPATFFLATDYIERSEGIPWWDALEQLIVRAGNCNIDLEGRTYDLSRQKDRCRFFFCIRNKILTDPKSEMAIIKKTSELFGSGDMVFSNRFARWSQLEKANPDLFDFGAHATSHHFAITFDTEQLLQELLVSKQQIEDRLHRQITLLAYPYGGWKEIQCVEVDPLREAGFRGAVTTMLGHNNRSSDTFFLKRIGISSFCSHGLAFKNYLLFADAIALVNPLYNVIRNRILG